MKLEELAEKYCFNLQECMHENGTIETGYNFTLNNLKHLVKSVTVEHIRICAQLEIDDDYRKCTEALRNLGVE
jgi:hypothetical protein